MRKPKSFEEMRAPAVTGQLSPDEYEQMAKHVEHCPFCCTAPEEFSLLLQQLPTDECDRANGPLLGHLDKGGLRQRFLKRARAEGIQFSDDVQNPHGRRGWGFPRLIPAYQWAAAGVIFAMVLIASGYLVGHRGGRQPLRAASQLLQEREVTSPAHNNYELEAKLAELRAITETSQKTISSLQSENALLLTRIGAMEKGLVASQAEKRSLQQILAHLSDTNLQLAGQNDHNADIQARTKVEMEEVRARRAEMEAEVAAQKAELGRLSRQLQMQVAAADRERELLAAGRDVRDLMGARNLHIIDVHDADGSGKNEKSFGRIFYTEGKSLIFYAFDLNERKLANAKYSFEVWGERLGEPTSVRSLGILYADDKDQKRWALNVDDPRQVAEIDSVFVTLEPHEGGDKPRGKKILYAFLGGKANHP